VSQRVPPAVQPPKVALPFPFQLVIVQLALLVPLLEIFLRPTHPLEGRGVVAVRHVVDLPVLGELTLPFLQVVRMVQHVAQDRPVPAQGLLLPFRVPLVRVGDLATRQQFPLRFEFRHDVPTHHGPQGPFDGFVQLEETHQFRPIPTQNLDVVRSRHDRAARRHGSPQAQTGVETRLADELSLLERVRDLVVPFHVQIPPQHESDVPVFLILSDDDVTGSVRFRHTQPNESSKVVPVQHVQVVVVHVDEGFRHDEATVVGFHVHAGDPPDVQHDEEAVPLEGEPQHAAVGMEVREHEHGGGTQDGEDAELDEVIDGVADRNQTETGVTEGLRPREGEPLGTDPTGDRQGPGPIQREVDAVANRQGRGSGGGCGGGGRGRGGEEPFILAEDGGGGANDGQWSCSVGSKVASRPWRCRRRLPLSSSSLSSCGKRRRVPSMLLLRGRVTEGTSIPSPTVYSSVQRSGCEGTLTMGSLQRRRRQWMMQ
jgi:hypothetical protein